MIWVRVPDGPDPALKPILRKPGPKRGRYQDTAEETARALGGGGAPSKPRLRSDYFTGEPEEVELTQWVRRMLRRGSLEEVTPANPPKSASKKNPEPPVPL
jgi:hypothetical protein